MGNKVFASKMSFNPKEKTTMFKQKLSVAPAS